MTNTEQERTIVVGFDASEGAHLALDWAIQEAKLRGARLSIVRAWTSGEFGTDAEIARFQQEHLDQEMRDAMKEHEGVEWAASAVRGSAAKVLLEQAAGADMLVVGSRGHGGFTGLLLGSVSQQVVSHAGAAVVVVVRTH